MINKSESWGEKLHHMGGPWASENLIRSKNGVFKVRVMENHEAPWHEHPSTDEIFIVLSGNLEIDLEGATHLVPPGGIFLVPSKTRHRARAMERVELIVYEGA